MQVRPLVMGVTEVGRDSSHVLMSMGFREVDNVLTNAVLTGTGSQTPKRKPVFFHGFSPVNFSKLRFAQPDLHFQVYMP